MKTTLFKTLSLSTLFALGAACGPGEVLVTEADDGASFENEAPVTWVDQSKVERQSIGNCWIYATTGWAESVNKAATGEAMNLSQSYLTYWHWFDQIVTRRVGTISTGGSFNTALAIFDRYGMMVEGDFIPTEATAEMSARQAAALDALNLSLKSGVLSDPAKRADRAVVRAELDRVWRLDAEVVRLFNNVFGASVSRTLERSYTARRPPSLLRANGARIFVMRPVDVPAQAKQNGELVTVTLADVMGTSNGWSRSGTLAWREASYPSSPTSRRALQKRIQRALNDHQPVVMSWFVDFNALARDGSFSLEQLRGGAGRQGGHMVVMHDYEVDGVPGYGTLKAGVNETRPEALEAALSDQATVKFFRVKNSWGTYRPDRWDDAPIPGYHDLYVTYLNGPIKKCGTTPAGETDTSNCTTNTQPWWDVVLPAGY